VFDWPTEYLQIKEQGVAEAAQGHTIEAHGVRGMDRRTWHKTFRDTDQMTAWAEKHDAEIMGTRDLEQARRGNLSPAEQGVAEAFPNPGSGSTGSSKEDKRIAAALRKKHIPTTPNDKKEQGVAEGLTEMDKSQPSAGRDGNRQSPRDDRQSHGRDTGPRPGPERVATPITPEKMVKHALNTLAKSMAKKDVSEDQLDELSKDTLKDYMRAQPARIKGPTGLATTNPKKAARIVDPQKGDMRRALTKLKDPEYGQQGMAESNVFTDARMNAIKAGEDTFVVHGKTYQVTGDTTDERQAGLAEDSLAAMRRLAGIVPQLPVIVPNGQRQYRHMPTAVQPR